MTLLNPQYFDFILDQKLQNVFTENFLVQIHQKFREIHSEVRIQHKKKLENAFRILKPRAKKEIRGAKKKCGEGGEENLLLCCG
jgi:t-SNARE complex subunit (syntaxin)